MTASFRVVWPGLRRSLARTALLFVITAGAYWLIWLGRVYAALRARAPASTRVRPAIATALLLVPLVNLAFAAFLALDLPRSIRRAQAGGGEVTETEPLAVLLLAAPFGAIALALAIGIPLLLVGYAAWPMELPAMLVVQRALNRLPEHEAEAAPQRRAPSGSRRTLDGELLGSGLLVAAIGAGLLVALAVSGGGDEQSRPLPIAPSKQFSDIAIGPGALWVTRLDNATLERLDPRNGRQVGRPIRVGLSPLDVASGYGAIWVANYRSGTISRIDWTSGRAQAPPIAVGRGPFGVTVGGGSVWVANQVERNVVQIDPKTNRVKLRVPIGRGPRGLDVGEDAVWAAASEGRAVYRIDPRSGETTKIRLGRFVQDVAAGGGSVWAATPEQNQVIRIDPAKRRIRGAPIGVGLGPTSVDIGDGFVWVANSVDGTVARIDPRSAKVVGKPIGVGKGVTDLAVRGKAVWVLRVDGKVRRIRIGAPPKAGSGP